MQLNYELMSNILLYTLAARGFLALIWNRLPWPEEPETYQLSELQAGAHCGLCGKWMAEEIVPKDWSWSLCEAH